MKYLTVCNATSAPQHSFDHSKNMTAIPVQRPACKLEYHNMLVQCPKVDMWNKQCK